MLLIINSLYLVVLLMLAIMSLFIVFHIVKYAHSKSGALFMLALFLPVVAVLIFLNANLFLSINFTEVISYLLKA